MYLLSLLEPETVLNNQANLSNNNAVETTTTIVSTTEDN